jgi:hypothetical protein
MRRSAAVSFATALALAATARGQATDSVPPLPGDISKPMLPDLADKWARRDSAYDGWESEVFNERAGKQLSALGKLFGHPADIDGAHLEPLVDASFECGEVRPSRLAEVFESGGLRVRRGAPAELEAPHRGVEGAAAALRALAAPYEGAVDPVAKFKIVGVDLAERHALTTAYFQSKGRPESGALQQNATWTIRWTALAGETLPRLAGIEVADYAETQAQPGGAPLFADCTEAVLGANASYPQQLLAPLEQWAATLDLTLGMSLIGHEGLALGDVDGDLLDDLYLPQPGGLPNRLFLRRRDGTLRDASRESGADFLDASRSALFSDFDGDGDQDLAVELDPSIVFLANDGKGRFEVVFEAHAPSTTSLSAADYDADGDLDLYCCGYVLPDTVHTTPLPYHDANNGRPNTLLRNDTARGAWRFADATRECGLDENNRRFSFAAAWEDYDRDGDLDLYVSNDFGRNNLYRNEGGRFRDVAAEAGVEDMAAGMGVTWADFDRDGWDDLHVANMFSSAGERVTYQRRFKPAAGDATRGGFQRHARGDTLFRNLGDGTFADVSEAAGITMGRWAWGAVFADFDNDAWPDLYVPNGYVTGEDPEDL